MIVRFEAADCEEPSIFVLSLKAGVVALNLTAANQRVPLRPLVAPAVENQAAPAASREWT